MPMTATTTVSPTTMTTNWGAALQNPTNVAKLLNKYQNPKALYNANPQAAQTALLNGVTRAVQANKYANAMANSDVNQAAANMVSYGGANWSNAGVNKLYKYQKVSANLAAAISAVRATVNAMPKGRGANNQARMNAWFTGMSAYYGKIK